MQTGLISLEEDDPIAIEAFLEFLYTDFVSEQTLQSSGKELLVVASKYQVSLLSKQNKLIVTRPDIHAIIDCTTCLVGIQLRHASNIC